ncbi:hypothetical protein PC129_g8657 [Phytophthora cactorum]|uniref:Uncharacterized protein n=1 Tax=Phytophthora cactorum TaxID=29920 RepID=A0A329SST3_9STRA|nr:hypothetical protein Pcac1_g25802 [Phytophthora cactorum]KAG2817773.1 hypothetical protein PC112_g12912 [Phytophthora cactorum]KAG2819815.1 hypothetical protein PC111_g11730 [Phytophthora cactorum]KAG2856891.1 hypothetical protein PC113_g11170 [Phytophthora cactorum]KAG2898312.1 hypothetical protein PC114_g14322 [Phytophthora cactorum]
MNQLTAMMLKEAEIFRKAMIVLLRMQVADGDILTPRRIRM